MSAVHPAVSQVNTLEEADLASLFLGACTRHGSRIALCGVGAGVTYAELAAQAQRIAGALRARGAGRGTIVAICLERSPAMIAAMLGVTLAGAAYLPLDIRYPAARLAETIADALPMALLLSHAEPAPEVCCPVLCVEDLLEEKTSAVAFPAIEENDPAYVIYTSGSTGKPKGVLVSHHNVARLMNATEAWFGFNEHDVWTMFHSFAFDFSVWEIWGCLLHGGRLVLVPYPTSRSPEDFHALLVREGVTVLNQTPSAFALLDRVDADRPLAVLALRVVILGGEALNPGLLRGWFARHGDQTPKLINMYGITETTVHVTYREMSAGDAEERDCLIGRAIPDLQLHLLDGDLRPVQDGEQGELCIGGAGVALGYLYRPALNAERYVHDPFTGTGAKLYRSGDMARRRADGELAFLGRRDGQVKINGFRIEPGEVESAMLAHPRIAQACVISTPGPDGLARLAAYLVPCAGQDLTVAEIGRFARARLPAQMLPALYHVVEYLPLNRNGKIDRAALATMSPPAALGSMPLGSDRSAADRITAIWQRVLGNHSISVEDNFFDVGGTSVLLVQVRTALEAEFGRPVSISTLFECPTVQALADGLSDSSKPVRMEATPFRGAGHLQREAFARARALRSNAK